MQFYAFCSLSDLCLMKTEEDSCTVPYMCILGTIINYELEVPNSEH